MISPESGDGPMEIPKPKKREAWKKRHRTKLAKGPDGKLTGGHPQDLPATPKEAQQMMKKLASDALTAVVASKDIPPAVSEKYAKMTAHVRAQIFSYLGEDIEAAKAEFAKELLANAREVSQHLMQNYKDFPPSVQAFIFCSMTDKAEAVGTKVASTARGAAVDKQINLFMSGDVDKEAIIRTLTGESFQPPIQVKAVTPLEPGSSPP